MGLGLQVLDVGFSARRPLARPFEPHCREPASTNSCGRLKAKGLYRGCIGNGKENGSYYLGFRV